MTGIKLTHITYHPQKNQSLLTNMTLHFKKHAITCLVGANGSGKSTLLKLLTGLITPQSGTVTLDNVLIHSYTRKSLAKQLAYLPQQCRIPESLTVREYIALGRFCHQTWFSNLNYHDHIAITEAIRLTDLDTLADQSMGKLSCGQQQRARIALMLAQQTPYILLDEPMTGLDIKQQRNILDILIQLQKNHAKTIVVILHDLHQVMEIAQDVILLKNGSILAQGHPSVTLNHNFLSHAFDYSFDRPLFNYNDP